MPHKIRSPFHTYKCRSQLYIFSRICLLASAAWIVSDCSLQNTALAPPPALLNTSRNSSPSRSPSTHSSPSGTLLITFTWSASTIFIIQDRTNGKYEKIKMKETPTKRQFCKCMWCLGAAPSILCLICRLFMFLCFVTLFVYLWYPGIVGKLWIFNAFFHDKPARSWTDLVFFSFTCLKPPGGI